MKNNENDRAFKAQSYLRLLKFAAPYWKRLTFGIICGMLVGGSLFFALMLLPQLVGLVDSGSNIGVSDKSLNADSEEMRKLREIVNDPALDNVEKNKRITQALSRPSANDPKLRQLLAQAQSFIDRFKLPCTIEGTELKIHWPVKKSFEIVTSGGQVAWPLFAIYTTAFLVVWLLRSVCTYLNGYCTRYVGIRAVADMRSAIFRKLSEQSMRFYGEMDVGHLISRCTNDTSALEYSVSHSIEDLTNAPLQVLGCLAAIIVACRQYNSYSLVITLVLGMVAIIVPIQLLGRAIRKYYKRCFARIAWL